MLGPSGGQMASLFCSAMPSAIWSRTQRLHALRQEGPRAATIACLTAPPRAERHRDGSHAHQPEDGETASSTSTCRR
jgi:hypothetical protein